MSLYLSTFLHQFHCRLTKLQPCQVEQQLMGLNARQGELVLMSCENAPFQFRWQMLLQLLKPQRLEIVQNL
jgi:hypothetical protein